MHIESLKECFMVIWVVKEAKCLWFLGEVLIKELEEIHLIQKAMYLEEHLSLNSNNNNNNSNKMFNNNNKFLNQLKVVVQDLFHSKEKE